MDQEFLKQNSRLDQFSLLYLPFLNSLSWKSPGRFSCGLTQGEGVEYFTLNISAVTKSPDIEQEIPVFFAYSATSTEVEGFLLALQCSSSIPIAAELWLF